MFCSFPSVLREINRKLPHKEVNFSLLCSKRVVSELHVPYFNPDPEAPLAREYFPVSVEEEGIPRSRDHRGVLTMVRSTS